MWAAIAASSIAARISATGSSAVTREISKAATCPASCTKSGGGVILAQRGQKVTTDAAGKKHEIQARRSKQSQAVIKKEDWNEYEITASGNHLIHKINGQVTAEVTTNRPTSGRWRHSGAQLHAGPPMKVEFKDIRLKRHEAGRRPQESGDGGRHAESRAGRPRVQRRHDALEAVSRRHARIVAVAYYNGWPADPTAFDNADTILLYMDGGGGHRSSRAIAWPRSTS